MKYKIILLLPVLLVLASCSSEFNVSVSSPDNSVIINASNVTTDTLNLTFSINASQLPNGSTVNNYYNITNITSFNITNITSYNITNITAYNITNVTNVSNYNITNVTNITTTYINSQAENITRRNVMLNVLNTGTAYGVFGDVATLTGTGSTPAVNISAGLQLNILGVAGTTSGLSCVNGNTNYYRDWGVIGVFKFRSVEVTNDTRKFTGFTTNTCAVQFASDQPTGDYIGVIGSNTKWTNYAIVSSNNGIVQSINTTLAHNNADVMNVTVSMNVSGCSVIFNGAEYTFNVASCPRTGLAYRYAQGQINTSTTVRNLRTSSIFISSGQ